VSIIRVEITGEVSSRHKASKWRWVVAEHGLGGLSRSPLLDACRAIKRMGGDYQRQQIGLYRNGRLEMSCSLEIGADLDVRENAKEGPAFVKWNPSPVWGQRRKAEHD
jgi:hypothetical protein